VNIGLGRLDPHRLSEQVTGFVNYLKVDGKSDLHPPRRFAGHAYLVREFSTRRVAAPGVLLIGDAAGVAYSRSGEGIHPAVRSGLAAAETIIAGGGTIDEPAVSRYKEALARLDEPAGIRIPLPSALAAWIGRSLMRSRRFVSRVVLDDWFLHAG
jgi:flavin-dependent dehydrogenase